MGHTNPVGSEQSNFIMRRELQIWKVALRVLICTGFTFVGLTKGDN
jgi:hypothetical protein